MDDWQDDVTLLRFVDDVENAKFYGEKHGFGTQTMEGLGEVHGSLIDLGPLIQSAESLDTMTELMGGTIDDLNESCIAGKESDVQARTSQTMAAIQSVRKALQK